MEFIQAYQSASKQLLDSEFCLGYELTHCQEEVDHFIMRIEWTSTEDHLNGFRKSPEFRDFFNHIKPFFNNIEEMHHYNLTEVAKKKQ
jgi:quinol monooxygenase YgiN